MNSEDQNIINSADRWEDLKHKREMYRLEKQHERRSWVMKTILGGLFDAPGFVFLIFSLIVGLGLLISHHMSNQVVYDCSGADPAQLERMKSECEDLSADSRSWCHDRILETVCTPTSPGKE